MKPTARRALIRRSNPHRPRSAVVQRGSNDAQTTRTIASAYADFTNRPPPSGLASRDEGLNAEIDFWRTWLVGRGLEWPDDYDRRFDASLPLQPELMPFALATPTETVDVLDVGAGPVTRLGKAVPGKRLRLVATDLLADAYNALIDERRVAPLLRTRYADAEKLFATFGRESFDVVHAQNTASTTWSGRSRRSTR